MIIGIIVLVVIIVVLLITTNTNKNKNMNNDNNSNNNSNKDAVDIKDVVDEFPSAFDFDNKDNARINGNYKECISSKLKEVHVVKNMSDMSNSKLSSSGAKFYGNKNENIIHVEVPITNNSDKVITNSMFTIGFIKNKSSIYFELDGIIDELKPSETKIIKLSTDTDVTNSYNYIIYLYD